MRTRNPPTRKAAITAAVILGIFAVLYLGGLFGQIHAGYQDWLSQDGMSGGAAMTPIHFSLFFCIPYAFSESGYGATLLVMITTAGIFIYVKLQDRFQFGKGEFDERNFKRAKEGTYGTAAWMSDREMKQVLEVTSPGAAHGTILGEKNGKVVCLPTDTMLNKHIFVCGASGTMKSRAIVRNLLFQSVKRGESVVLTDPKAELYDDTAELFRQSGYQVKVFNLVNPEHSDSWNCMANLAGDTLTTQILADVIISNTSRGKIDHFWDNGEGNLLKSLILYVDQDHSRDISAKHLPAVYQLLTRHTEKQINALFDRLPITHPAKAPYNLFAQASDTVRAGIVLGLGTRLQILQNDAIQKITSHSHINLAEPGKTKCAYFVILSDQESSTEFLSSLFFSFLFIRLTRYADGMPDRRCAVPVNIIFEELNNIGRLDAYPRRLSVARSRAIQICHIVQSLAQFQNRYPDAEWAEIIGNCDTQIMLGVTEQEGAEFFSSRGGDSTVRVNSTMAVKQTIALTQMIPQYRETDGLGRRRLLTPDEILRFPNDEILIILRGQNVLRAKKFDYTGHPYAKKLIRSSIFDYIPQAALNIPSPQNDPEKQLPLADRSEINEKPAGPR
ncbi:MAG: type IV secretory system conjugative DNA transfer family protein, partial [Peptococcaceae bacterium]|nr:type IV secretory system conjugative DNA transfer family protein [Peptococcaceae bacterium]